MKLGTMFLDVARSLFRTPATEPYPFKKHVVPAHARGLLTWDPTRCTGCGQCAKDCPAFALEVIVLDRKAKRFVMNYDLGRCAYCGQCVETCRFRSLSMVESEWELASANSKEFAQTWGNPDDIREALAMQAG